jgi:hypothetical protein
MIAEQRIQRTRRHCVSVRLRAICFECEYYEADMSDIRPACNRPRTREGGAIKMMLQFLSVRIRPVCFAIGFSQREK